MTMRREGFVLAGALSLALFAAGCGSSGFEVAEEDTGGSAAGYDAFASDLADADLREMYAAWAGEDGQMTVAEWDDAVDQRYGEDPVNLAVARWDTDADGIITWGEFARQAMTVESAAVAGDWDADGDGRVTDAEFDEGVFGLYDENDDGVLDEEEYGAYEADDGLWGL